MNNKIRIKQDSSIMIIKPVCLSSPFKNSLFCLPLLICLLYAFSAQSSEKKGDTSETNGQMAEEPFEFGSTDMVSLFHTNYILPFYYTGSPYREVYEGHTPDNQEIKRQEMKFQISLLIPLFYFNNEKDSINTGYTQVSYWQFYSKSQFFRESNYAPELFFSHQFNDNWKVDTGVIHQSNGKGGALERSWNRSYINLEYKRSHYYINIRPWLLVFKSDSSDLHNPDISNYLGYGDITLGYRVKNHIFTLMERSFKRPSVEFTWNFPIYGTLSGFVNLFSGYGQSLIEYNHHTNSGGIGIALNSGWL